jgi:hypothetical protein
VTPVHVRDHLVDAPNLGTVLHSFVAFNQFLLTERAFTKSIGPFAVGLALVVNGVEVVHELVSEIVVHQLCPTMHATHRDAWSTEAFGIDRVKGDGCFAECAVLCVAKEFSSVIEDVGAMGIVCVATYGDQHRFARCGSFCTHTKMLVCLEVIPFFTFEKTGIQLHGRNGRRADALLVLMFATLDDPERYVILKLMFGTLTTSSSCPWTHFH